MYACHKSVQVYIATLLSLLRFQVGLKIQHTGHRIFYIHNCELHNTGNGEALYFVHIQGEDSEKFQHTKICILALRLLLNTSAKTK